MNLTHLAQSIDLYYSEAEVLQAALATYHEELIRSGRPLTLAQASSIRPTAQVLNRLTRRLLGSWRYDYRRHTWPRKFRLDYDELLHLRQLYFGGLLRVPGLDRPIDLWNVCGRIDAKAHNLTPYFQLS